MSNQRTEEIREMVREALREAIGGKEAKPIESAGQPSEYRAPWTGTAYQSDPSQRILVESGSDGLPLFQIMPGQDCPLEKRPCDDCGRCRSLGF